ncbi:MAG TPA: glycosyltransferase [Terriglobia bacterium]|nr:glycosyltransferase [Terriglobia bacterium]
MGCPQSGVIKERTLEAADLLVAQRLFPAPGTVPQIEKIFQIGKPVVFEMDDLLIDVPASNPNYEFAMMCRPYVLDVISRSHAVTTSTAALRSQLLHWNSNIYVLPNLIDERLWRHAPIHQTGPVVIGFAGTTTHGDDLVMIEEAFSLISQRHGRNVAFHFLGCVTERLSRLPGATHAQFTPDYESYSQALQSTRMDLAVVPLVDNRFNTCKSNIKWLEFSACGIAGVYSDLPPYNSCIRHGQTGLLVGNRVHDWFQAIDTLVTNASLRRAISQRARQEVLSDYTLASPRVRLYAEAYHAILGRPLQDSSVSSIARSVTLASRTCQIRGIDLQQAVAQEPHLQSVVERVNRALSLVELRWRLGWCRRSLDTGLKLQRFWRCWKTSS